MRTEPVHFQQAGCAFYWDGYERARPAPGGTRSWVPKSEARRKEPEIPPARRRPQHQPVAGAGSGRATSAGRCARSMTTRSANLSRTTSSCSWASST